MRRVVAGLLWAVLGSHGAMAAGLFEGHATSAGIPIRQDFVGSETSLVRTERAEACVVSGTIDIAASRYVAPLSGDPIPFDSVTRSHAASVQVVAPRDGEVFVRVQLKYSPRPGTPILLGVADETIALDDMLEPSGDSLRIEAPALVAALRSALEAGDMVWLSATSRDTGRAVQDRLPEIDFARFDACRAGEGLETVDHDAAPSSFVAIAFDAAPTPETRATEDDARICRVDDASVELHRGQLRHVEGFFSQTERVFVSFAPDGSVDRVFIPGIFEGLRLADGRLETRLSIAANGNDPIDPARVSGCLGDRTVHLCEDETGAFGTCFGEFLSGDLFDDGEFLSGFTMPASTFRPTQALPAIVSRDFGPTGGGGGGGFFFGSGGGGGGGNRVGDIVVGDDPNGPPPGFPENPPEPPVAPIPLPASALMLLSALMGYGLLGLRARRRPQG